MDPNWLPFHPNPSKPRIKLPKGAVDAHCHVFGPANKFPFAPERKYTPCDASKEQLFKLRDFLGFERNAGQELPLYCLTSVLFHLISRNSIFIF